MKRAALVLTLLLCAPLALFAQNTGTGLPPFGSLSSFGFDTVNNQNLNVYFSIPLVSSPGRGIPLSINLTNNSLIWQKSGSVWTPVTDANGNPTWGWLKDTPAGGFFSYTTATNQIKCFQGLSWFWTYLTSYSAQTYVDILGSPHGFPNYSTTSPDCPAYDKGSSTSHASDASGYFLNEVNPSAITVTSPRGEEEVNGSGTAVDANGNYITKTVVSSTETDYTDSVGNKTTKILYTPNSTNPTEIQYEFLDGTGSSNYKTITLYLTSTNIKTNFGCSGVVEYSGTANLPTELDIPTPSGATLKYFFSYEQPLETPAITPGACRRLLFRRAATSNTSIRERTTALIAPMARQLA